MNIKISEAVQLFLVGIIPLAIVTTLQIWSSFRSTDKNKEAKISITVGLVITITYSTILLFMFGSLNSPLQTIQTFLQSKVDMFTLILWTMLLVAIPNMAKKMSKIIIGRGSLIRKYPKEFPKKRIANPKKNNNQKVIFKDTLNKNLDNWHTISGIPQISNIRGLSYPPSLLLEEYPSDSRNTFISAKNVNIKNGKITCDVYLEREAVFNVVFRANNSFSDFYMARIDSRSAGSSGILITSNSRSWGYIKQPNSYILNDRWYHIELNFRNLKIQLKIDSEIIAEEDSKIQTAGFVGMFNELKRVFVNNFIINEN